MKRYLFAILLLPFLLSATSFEVATEQEGIGFGIGRHSPKIRTVSTGSPVPPATAMTPLIHLTFDESAMPLTNSGSLGGTFNYSSQSAGSATFGVTGKFGNAIRYGVGNYTEIIGIDALATASDSFTIGGWLKPNGVQNAWAKTFTMGRADGNVGLAFDMGFDNSGLNQWWGEIKFTDGNCGVNPGAAYPLVSGTYYDVMFKYDASGRVFSAWLNGSKIAETACTQTGAFIWYNPDYTGFGFPYYAQSFAGDVDEMYVFDGIYTPVCGDGVATYGEQCDDGNTADGDTCSATCTVPPIYNTFSDSNYFRSAENDVYDTLAATNSWIICQTLRIASTANSANDVFLSQGKAYSGATWYIQQYSGALTFYIAGLSNLNVISPAPANKVVAVCFGEDGTGKVAAYGTNGSYLTYTANLAAATGQPINVGRYGDTGYAADYAGIYSMAAFNIPATEANLRAKVADGTDGSYATTDAVMVCNGQEFSTGCSVGGNVFTMIGTVPFSTL